MEQKDTEEEISRSLSENSDDEGSESEVEYPLINLKDGLSNNFKERRRKDIEKFKNRNQKETKIKSNEFSSKLIIDNKLAQFEMTKAVNYFFSEYDFIREKIQRSQQSTMKQLHEIHLEKRKQIRESYKYHNEETRNAIQRMKDEEKFLLEQAELEDMMRKRERSIAQLSKERKMLLKETNIKSNEKSTGKKKKSHQEIHSIQQADSIESSSSKKDIARSRSFLHAGALEVTKDYNNPKIIKRKAEYIESYDNPFLESNESINILNLDKDIEEVQRANEVTIQSLDVVENYKNENFVLPVKKTAQQIMKEIKKQKENKIKEILSLPYNIYRRNSKGKLQKVDHPLVKCEFKKPSNREKYQRKKVLGDEREKYQDSISKLTKTTKMMIQEDKKMVRQLNAPQSKIVKESAVLPYRKIGPKDWMKAYVSSNIPDDIDPSSTEAIIYCRYIRAPLHKYSHLPNYKLYHSPL